MSLFSIAKGLTLKVPSTALSLAQEAVSRSLGSIYDMTDWSMQKGFGGWLAPGMVFNTGTTTTTPYSNQVICDAYVTAQLAAYTGQPLITQLQYRNMSYSVYDIVGYDAGTINPPFATLTLDRPWLEPTSGPGQPFAIYQVYYVAPVQDFRKFIQISDPTNYQYIDFWSATQADLAVWDPARRDFSIPRFCVPAGPDLRTGSATYGWQRFELWPHQGNYLPYEFEYRRRGALPQSPTDYLTMSPPYPITEEMVDWRAKEILFQEKSAQMEERVPGSGKGMMILSQSAQREFMYLFGQALSIDLNLDGEQQNHKIRRGRYNRGTPYAGMNGTLNLGGYPNN